MQIFLSTVGICMVQIVVLWCKTGLLLVLGEYLGAVTLFLIRTNSIVIGGVFFLQNFSCFPYASVFISDALVTLKFDLFCFFLRTPCFTVYDLFQDHRRLIRLVREARFQTPDNYVAIALDIKGPEIRTGPNKVLFYLFSLTIPATVKRFHEVFQGFQGIP